MTKVLQIACLGPLKITKADLPVADLDSVKAQALLCYLMVDGRMQQRQAMANLLWGDLPEADARRNLRGVIMKLRQSIGEEFFDVSHQTIAFNRATSYELDCALFALGNERSLQDWETLAETAALYRGEFLEQFYVRQAPEFEDWVDQQRQQWQATAVTIYDKLVTACWQQKAYEPGIEAANRLLQLDSIRESSMQSLMRLLALNGQRASALREFEQFRIRLQDELGIDVLPETAVLADQIREGALPTPSSPFLKVPVTQSVLRAVPQNPFIAGPPITQPALFFGRERIVRRVFNLLKQRPLQNAAIIGPRRSGKTSLLHYLKTITTALPGELRAGQAQDWLPQPQIYRWIFVDFQDPRMGSRENLMRHLLQEMELPVSNRCDIETFLDTVSEALSDPTIILFDEIGVAIERYPDLDDAFWESLRSLATNQVNGNLAFILASHAAPDNLAQHSGLGSPFFNIFGYSATLGAMSEDEARQLIAASPIPFSEEAVEWILAESGGWPLLIQILCREHLLALEEGDTGDDWQEDGRSQIIPFLSLKARKDNS